MERSRSTSRADNATPLKGLVVFALHQGANAAPAKASAISPAITIAFFCGDAHRPVAQTLMPRSHSTPS